MIYTITTNPSLDYAVEADLIPGRVNRTRSETIYPGGKGINVSLCLQRLGMETRALGFAAGRIGQAIRDMLDDLDCPHELLELSGGGQSRINVKFRGTASQPETAVMLPAAPAARTHAASILAACRSKSTSSQPGSAGTRRGAVPTGIGWDALTRIKGPCAESSRVYTCVLMLPPPVRSGG